MKHDIVMKPEQKKQTGFFKSNKAKYPMFPFREEKIKYDEYGELIRYEERIILANVGSLFNFSGILGLV